jgi:polar amino acid transport system substrate-binding protein
LKKLFVLAVSVFIFSVQPLLSAELTILTENLPNLNYIKDGELVGLSVDIVKEIQKRVGSHEQIKVFPWARAYNLALREENVVLFSMTHTEARKDLAINSLEDAKKVKRIGTIRDDSKERLLKSHGFTNLESVSDEQKNAKKLILGRIDLWVNKQPGLKTVCDLAGVDYNQIEEVFHLRKRDLCIAFSKNTSDSIVLKWKNTFHEMLADGTIQQIRNKWNVE